MNWSKCVFYIVLFPAAFYLGQGIAAALSHQLLPSSPKSAAVPSPANDKIVSKDTLRMLRKNSKSQTGSFVPQNPGWKFHGMDGGQKELFLHYAKLGNQDAVRLIDQMAPNTWISLQDETSCNPLPTVMNCALKTSDNKRPYWIQFAALNYAPSAQLHYIIHHELGHVIHYQEISKSELQEFVDLFAQSPQWQDCFWWQAEISTKPHCVNEAEIFAEQFALWSTATPQSFSSYQLPRLANPEEFYHLLQKATY